MKSIKQQYIDLQEGNMTQANFMRNLRMTLPQYVTNVTSFEDSVRILKNKGILTEADTKTKWTNTSGKVMYDQFKEIDNLNGQEVLIGIDYEMEKNHELSKADAAKIVLKNLKKIPNYYTNFKLSGKEGSEPEYIGGKSANAEARQMQPLDKNMGNVVDKKMGMQPVKGVEKAKKDSDKATAQKYKTSGIDLMSLIAKTVRGVKKMDATGEKMKKVSVKEGYEDWLSAKKGEEERAADENEIHNGLKIGDKVKVNSEAALKLDIDPDEIFTISSFRKIKPGSLMQSIDVILKNESGNEAGVVNIEYVYEAGEEPVSDVVFNKNPKLANLKKAMGLEEKSNKLTKESLMQMIREELAEITADGRDNVTDVAGHQLDEAEGTIEVNNFNEWLNTLLEVYGDYMVKQFNTLGINPSTATPEELLDAIKTVKAARGATSFSKDDYVEKGVIRTGHTFGTYGKWNMITNTGTVEPRQEFNPNWSSRLD